MNKSAFLTAALAFAALPCLAATSVKATVNGMACELCAQNVEKRLSKLGAKAVFVDLKSKTVVAEAKEGQTLDQKAVAAEIASAGFAVVKLETVPLSVAEIKAGQGR